MPSRMALVAALVSSAALLALTGWTGWMLGRGSAGTPAGALEVQAPPTAAVARLERGTGEVGVLVSGEALDLSAPTEGRLIWAGPELGGAVERGGLVAQIETPAARQELARGEAAVRSARATVGRTELQVKLANQKLEGAQRLEDWVARAEVEQHRIERDMALAELRVQTEGAAQAEAELARLREKLRESEVRAPFSGRVAAQYQRPGVWVRVGMPVARLVSSGGMQIRFAVPQERAGSLVKGAGLCARTEGAKLPVSAVVEHVAPEVDSASGMIVAEARVTGLPEGALPGMPLRVFPGTCPEVVAESVASTP